MREEFATLRWRAKFLAMFTSGTKRARQFQSNLVPDIEMPVGHGVVSVTFSLFEKSDLGARAAGEGDGHPLAPFTGVPAFDPRERLDQPNRGV